MPKAYSIKSLEDAEDWTFYCFSTLKASCRVGGDSGKVITLRPTIDIERKSYRVWLVNAVKAPIDTSTGDEFAFKISTFYHTVIVDKADETSIDSSNT